MRLNILGYKSLTEMIRAQLVKSFQRYRVRGMITRVWAASMVSLLLTSTLFPQQQGGVGRGLTVAVIAPSVSTSMEARRLISQQGWVRGRFKTADAILVVVRSSLGHPLRSSYSFIGELMRDAESQLNISGSVFHIYIYDLGEDLECKELRHVSYPVE